jgi:hypothetical protein
MQQHSRSIADRGRDLILELLRPQDVVCYWKTLLEKYAEILDFEPDKREDYVEITMKKQQ